MFKRILIFIFAILLCANQVQANNQCAALFENPRVNAVRSLMTVPIANILKPLGPKAKGYTIIITSMLMTAALTHFLTTHMPTDYKFLTYFVTQVSVLGIVVIGAPIWEPASSYFRSLAFRMKSKKSSYIEDEISNLENQWTRTQAEYSLNSQMSRNLIVNVLNNIQISFYEAKKAFQEEDRDYAVKQIAMIAVRMKALFSDVHPNDKYVSQAFQSIFTYRDDNLKTDILNEIIKNDSTPTARDYYTVLLDSWLN